VTGSVAPDLPSFLPLGLTHDQTHPPTAILWPDGVLAVGLLLVWWVLLRPGLVPLWPGAAARCGRAAWHSSRLRAGRSALLPWVGWLALSELVGLATHLGWDAFTHSDGYVARRWSPLQGSVAGHLTVDWLQAASSVFGLTVVAVWLLVHWRREPAVPTVEPIGPRLRAGVVIGTVAMAVATGWVEWHRVSGTTTHLQVWSLTAKGAGGALLIGLGAWSLAWAALRAHRLVTAAEPHSSATADVP
jgi:hypothetical protein